MAGGYVLFLKKKKMFDFMVLMFFKYSLKSFADVFLKEMFWESYFQNNSRNKIEIYFSNPKKKYLIVLKNRVLN